jgi:hypothetical protein
MCLGYGLLEYTQERKKSFLQNKPASTDTTESNDQQQWQLQHTATNTYYNVIVDRKKTKKEGCFILTTW